MIQRLMRFLRTKTRSGIKDIGGDKLDDFYRYITYPDRMFFNIRNGQEITNKGYGRCIISYNLFLLAIFTNPIIDRLLTVKTFEYKEEEIC